MKNIIKKITALSIIAAMVPMCAVSAEDSDTSAGYSQTLTTDSLSKWYGCYITVVRGTVTAIDADEGIYHIEREYQKDCDIRISEDTVVIDADGEYDEIEAGDFVKAYFRWDRQELAAQVAVIGSDESIIDIDKYYAAENGSYINSAVSLTINADENTEIVDRYGNAAEIADGDDLIVFYKNATESYQEQAVPDKVIVLGQLGERLCISYDMSEEGSGIDLSGVSTIKAGNSEIEYTPVLINGKYMVPLRSVAEALGHIVNWNEKLRSITVDTAYSLTIGKDLYIVRAKVLAIKLGQGPVVINSGDGDCTYVPVECFDKVMKYNVSVDGDTLVIEYDTANLN